MYSSNKPNEICSDCRIIKISRSRHCHQCHRCVKKFDHHCQWINNCIGGKNLGFFYTFISALWFNIIIGVWLCCTVLISKKSDNDGDDLPLLSSQIVSIVCIFILLVLFLPVSYLFYTQTVNFINGLTTNERMSANKKPKKNNGCPGNFINMCCNTQDQDEIRSYSSTSTVFEVDVSMQEAKNGVI